MSSSLLFHSGELGLGEYSQFERLGNGSAVVRNKRVFRAGTFRDSRGRQQEWTREDLDEMVSNFSKLQTVLPNVPIRRDHSRTVDNVMGYFESLRSDGEFLFADFHITEPDDADKYERGTYRNVSIEVGSYTTNDEQEFNPVAMGLAFVDLPAVEGLFTLHQEDDAMSFTQEDLDWAAAAAYAQAVEDAAGVEEFALAVGYAQADLDVRAEFAAGDEDKPPFKFALPDGSETTDYAAVQADLTAMGSALAEQRDLFRHTFVDDLVRSSKIIAPMADTLKEHVSSLSDDQYASFAATYDQAPALPLLGDHGEHGAGPDGSEFAGEIARLEETVAFHKMSGLSDDQISDLPSFRQLQQLTTQAQEV